MAIPLGDFLRGLGTRLPKWLRVVLSFTKGTSINVHGTQIDLDQKNTMPGSTNFDSRPHEPGGFRR